MVDTCAAEFESYTPYYYSTYSSEDEVKPQGENAVIVLDPDQSVSDRGSNLTIVLFMLPGHCEERGRNLLLSIIILKLYLRILIHQTLCILNRSRKKMYWKLLKKKSRKALFASLGDRQQSI